MAGSIGTLVLNIGMGVTFIWVALALVDAIYRRNRRDIIGTGFLLFLFAIPLGHNLWLLIQKHVLPLGFGDIVIRGVTILFLLCLLAWMIHVFLWLISPHTSIFDLIRPPASRRQQK